MDWHVRQHNPADTQTEWQTETVETIRSVVADGLFRLGGEVVRGEHLGGVATEGEEFVAWHQTLDRCLQKISHNYVKHYDDPQRWMYAAYLELTEQGEQQARALESKDVESYRRLE
ncbi:hypothetical protein H0P51_04655 [Mycobacterium vicinigordonae]|uniref:Uncharacterized protein n=1 Tax=Mycobacterium vicinigordonae TaxID=1719132 RepID=A0A7D6I8W7_9MYCO|nr:hypothetical protein H0P51_04655 [Mycobacterium vicinigordonae]